MRGGALFVVAVLLLGSAACSTDETDRRSARAVPDDTVPQITDFPCPARPSTTFDLEVCGAQRTQRMERAINKEVRSIVSARMSAPARARFLRSERAWRAYRKALCESRRDLYEGGSASRVVSVSCMADESAAHLNELRTFKRDLQRGRA